MEGGGSFTSIYVDARHSFCVPLAFLPHKFEDYLRKELEYVDHSLGPNRLRSSVGVDLFIRLIFLNELIALLFFVGFILRPFL